MKKNTSIKRRKIEIGMKQLRNNKRKSTNKMLLKYENIKREGILFEIPK